MKEAETSKPLLGVRVLVTRGEGQSDKLSQKLRQAGCDVLEIPVIHFAPPSTWEPLDRALRSLQEYEWIIFVSANAVKSVLDRATTIGIAVEVQRGRLRFATIGPATSAMLSSYGLTADFQPDSFVAEDFIEQFPGKNCLEGVRILWPRTNVGRALIAERLGELGACIDVVEAYRTMLPPGVETIAQRLLQLISTRQVQVITLASSQTAKNFAEILSTDLNTSKSAQQESFNRQGFARLPEDVLLASIGPITSETIREIFGRVDIEAEVHTSDGLVDAIKKRFSGARTNH